jgi:hypothetical protein
MLPPERRDCSDSEKQYFSVIKPLAVKMPIESLFKPENDETGRLICDALASDHEEAFTGVPLTIHETDRKTEEINVIAQIVSGLVTFSEKYPDANQTFDLNELLESSVFFDRSPE